jgi:hypothetical protein
MARLLGLMLALLLLPWSSAFAQSRDADATTVARAEAVHAATVFMHVIQQSENWHVIGGPATGAGWFRPRLDSAAGFDVDQNGCEIAVYGASSWGWFTLDAYSWLDIRSITPGEVIVPIRMSNSNYAGTELHLRLADIAPLTAAARQWTDACAQGRPSAVRGDRGMATSLLVGAQIVTTDGHLPIIATHDVYRSGSGCRVLIYAQYGVNGPVDTVEPVNFADAVSARVVAAPERDAFYGQRYVRLRFGARGMALTLNPRPGVTAQELADALVRYAGGCRRARLRLRS